MFINLKILLIIILANGAPPVLAAFYPQACRRKVDGGRKLPGGRTLFGGHKSWGGLIGGIAAGSLCGYLIGISLVMSFSVAALSMLGDLFTSFLKRRIRIEEGESVYLFDQVFEGAFPLLLCKWVYALNWQLVIAWLLLFCAAAISGSWLGRELLPTQKTGTAFRLVRSPSSFREWRACHTALSPLARFLNFENIIYYRWIMRGVFEMLRIYKRGMRNARNIHVNPFTIACADLPEAFENYRILFISDLHLDGQSGLCERIIEQVTDLDIDVCFLGGDYRMEMYGDFTAANRQLGRLVQHIRAHDGVFGILGNHDCLEIAPALEDSRICMLINESITIRRNGSEISIVGVDDPHYYKCHDIEKAFADVPPDGFVILLAHSPEVITATDGFKIDLCLCGHTHAGQIRLPVVGPLFTHCRLPRRFTSGRWNYNGMIGYTSSGVGSSGIPVRFNCPPEIVLLTLTRKATPKGSRKNKFAF
jgi:predicted MPP superfamily phosphohydrolase